MSVIQERTEAIKELKNQIKNHVLCLELKEEKHHFLVFFPYPVYFGKYASLEGIRITIGSSKKETLEKLLAKLEYIYSNFDN